MNDLYLIAGIAVLVWAAVFVLRGSLMVGCVAFLIVAACFGHPFLHFDLGLVPMTLDRIALVLLVAAYFVQRCLGSTAPKPVRRTELLLVAFLGVLVASDCYGGWSVSPTQTCGPAFRLIAGYAIPFILYWIARNAPQDRSTTSFIGGLLACLGVYLAVTGLLEISGQWWAVFPKHIADPEVGIHFGRARGPMVTSVSYGLCLGICLLATWLWRWRFGRLGQLVIVALMPLMLAAVFFSYTRSVWMGVGLGVLIVLGLTLRGSWRPLVVGGIVAAALLLVATRMDDLMGFRRESSAAETKDSADMRMSFAYVSWQMFLDRPLWGVGFGQFPDAKLPYLNDRSAGLNLEAIRLEVHHNTFLSLLTETGLIGLVLFLAILAGWARTAWGLCHNREAPDWARAQGVLLLGVLAIYVCQAAFHELSYGPLDNSVVFLLAGMTVGLRPSAAPVTAPARTRFDGARLGRPPQPASTGTKSPVISGLPFLNRSTPPPATPG